MLKNTIKLNKLNFDFYNRNDVIQIAKELLGKIVVSNISGVMVSGRIVEVEAYKAFVDKASHAYLGKRTARNQHMYAQAATAYVYICYGIHQMLNIITNESEVPDAILIRAIQPLQGIETMMERTGKLQLDYTITKGPGNVGKALGINKIHSGCNFLGEELYLLSDDYVLGKNSFGESKRIGVDYAGEDAALLYRFFIKGNKYVSGRINK